MYTNQKSKEFNATTVTTSRKSPNAVENIADFSFG